MARVAVPMVSQTLGTWQEKLPSSLCCWHCVMDHVWTAVNKTKLGQFCSHFLSFAHHSLGLWPLLLPPPRRRCKTGGKGGCPHCVTNLGHVARNLPPSLCTAFCWSHCVMNQVWAAVNEKSWPQFWPPHYFICPPPTCGRFYRKTGCTSEEVQNRWQRWMRPFCHSLQFLLMGLCHGPFWAAVNKNKSGPSFGRP